MTVKRFTSVAHAQLLGLGRQLIEGCGSLLIDAVLVGHQVGQADAPVGADLAEGDLPLRQSLDQEGPQHVQQISGLLGGELGVHRHQRDGIALGHLHQEFPAATPGPRLGWERMRACRPPDPGTGWPCAGSGWHGSRRDRAGSPCGLSHLSRGDHGLNGARESEGHGREEQKAT